MSELWLVLIAFLTACGFLFYLPKADRGSHVLRYLVGLFCLWAVFAFVSEELIPPTIVRSSGWFLVFLSAGFLITSFFRAMLDQIGMRIRLWKRIGLPPYLLEITRAVEQMAGRKIGALIVLEQKQSLTPFFSKTVPFDAEIKSEVLVSLFIPTSLVHDGALIVQKGRIKAVKTVLPLTTKDILPMGIGTRHRSAIGISERTDAIALVVSEERGEVSVAYKGQLMKVTSSDQLNKLIHAALRGKSFEGERIESLTAHAGLK